MLFRFLGFLAAGLLSASCITATNLPLRIKYSDQLRAAEALCEQQGGLIVSTGFSPTIDVLTNYSGVGGAADPSFRKISTPSFDSALMFEQLSLQARYHNQPYAFAYTVLHTGTVRSVDFRMRAKVILSHNDCGWGNCVRGLYPEPGGADGFYRYELMPAASPNCKRFKQMREESGGILNVAGAQMEDAIEERGECIAVRFIAEAESYRPTGNSYVSFWNGITESGVVQKHEVLFDKSGAQLASLKQFRPAMRGTGCQSDKRDLLTQLGLIR